MPSEPHVRAATWASFVHHSVELSTSNWLSGVAPRPNAAALRSAIGELVRSNCSSCTVPGPMAASTWPNVRDWSGRPCNDRGSNASQPPAIGIDDSGRLLMAGTRPKTVAKLESSSARFTPPPGARFTPPPGARLTPPPGARFTPPPGARFTPPPGAAETSKLAARIVCGEMLVIGISL
ncbi:MAG TPA: hypothetical protein DCQ52_15910, partial [Acidimicrobiaceae bacterium]|nr:hypothetical protein [Acidimicrobiaceae bacterium]